MRKVLSPLLTKEYWLGQPGEKSPDGNPVYTPREIALLKASPDATPKVLLQVYETKAAFGAELVEFHVPANTVVVDERHEVSPREELGFAPPRPANAHSGPVTLSKRRHDPLSPEERAKCTAIAREILQDLERRRGTGKPSPEQKTS